MSSTNPGPKLDFGNYLEFISFGGLLRTQSYPFITPKNFDLNGKSVFITGGSQGIGRLLSLTCAQAGCSKIAVASRSENELRATAEETKKAAKDAGHPEPQVLALSLDVTSEDNVRKVAETVVAAFGDALDVLVNNAGCLETHNLIHESDPMNWWSVWEVNVRGTHLVTKYFLPAVLKSSLKTIVNLTSGLALMKVQGYSSYSPSKVVTCRYTEFLVSEYGEKGLLAFALEPGLSDTRLATQMHPILRALPKDDPALAPNTIVWLVKERREWLSGRVVSARWDMEKVLERKEEIMTKDLMKFKVALD